MYSIFSALSSAAAAASSLSYTGLCFASQKYMALFLWTYLQFVGKASSKTNGDLYFFFFFLNNTLFKNRKKIPKHISYEINVSLSSTLLLLQLSTPVFPVLVQMVVHAARFQQGLNASVLQAGITQPVPVSVFISFLHMKVISSHENQVFDQSVTYLSIFLRFGWLCFQSMFSWWNLH